MNYKEYGKKFCEEINKMLESNKLKASFVTGGGFAYDSIKYSQNGKIGDFDFMIVYDDCKTLVDIISKLKETNFSFEKKYLDLDLDLLNNKSIDIIRLNGNYNGIKSTINLVPMPLIKRICDFENEIIIKKIAHNRNTSLFFAYGSDNSRIVVNFISPSFITDDNEDHYIHLDFSHIEKNNNIYLGILADAILKGFNTNYDTLNFQMMRKEFIKNIHYYFKKNDISSKSYLKLFANNSYFPEYLKKILLDEFEKYGVINGKVQELKSNEPIVFTTDFNIDFEKKPFNFINNKEYNMTFIQYIEKMQDTEYDRQYLLDALGKFYGYLMSSIGGTKELTCDDIFKEIEVYGTNDLYLKNVEEYNINSIIASFINSLLKNREKYNNELINNFLMISVKFLSYLNKEEVVEILKKYNINNFFKKIPSDKKINVNTLIELDSFNEVGTYHNFTSKVMSKYTSNEIRFLDEKLHGEKDKEILDIMCGYGRIANELKKFGYKKITGIDSEKYEFLNIPKDFIYIKDDYLKHNFDQLFDFVYSLYNCYYSNEYLDKIVNKTHSVLNEGGLFILDCFNKNWRDEINPKFEKVLYNDDDYTLIIKRNYNKNSGNEKTWYELYYKSSKIKEYEYVQKFFSLGDVFEIINSSKWDSQLLDSLQLNSRTNSQKHVMVLRKK